jgi:hypothetical protein
MKNDGLDIVEGSTPSETEKETAHRGEAGNIRVEAPATQDSIALTVGRERWGGGGILYEGDVPGSTDTLSGSH